ncbi:MAG: hypothetical protein NTX88_01060 [Candidatus Atribacteria bacterium]|nr:hypothetical protein [Candidatus Atribacteria bacterium]
MRKYWYCFLFLLVVLSVGCGPIIPNYERVEIEALLERYGNSLLTQNHDLAKSCLVPGGPHDQNFDLTYQQIVNILTTQPEYSEGVCSIPIFGVAINQVTVDGDWYEVTLKNRQVCGYCESTYWPPYPIPVSEYAVSAPASTGTTGTTQFNKWVCFENSFLIDNDTVLVKKINGQWLIY